MPLSKEKMREYQRQRRAKACKPDVVNPVNVNQECQPTKEDIANQALVNTGAADNKDIPANHALGLSCTCYECTLHGGDEKYMYIVDKPANFGRHDCQCKHCQQNRRSKAPKVLNHGQYKTASELGQNEINRVGLPGDADYREIKCYT